MKTAPVLSAILAATITSTAYAQASYTDFTGTTDFSFNGSATIAGSTLRLVNNASNIGSTWLTSQLPVVNSFDTLFEFSFTNGRAEGLALVIQNSAAGTNAIGGPTYGLGYAGGGAGATGPAIANSIAIEIDLQQQSEISDQSNNEISIHTMGPGLNDENESRSIGRANAGINLADGQIHSLRVSYDPGIIEVFLDGSTEPLITAAWDMLGGGFHLIGPIVNGLNLPGGAAWVGFTAAGGGSGTQTARIHSFTFDSGGGIPCFAGNVGASSGEPIDVLGVNGSPGNFFRRVEVFSYDAFTFDMDAPPTATAPSFVIFATLGAADGTATVPTPFGEFCFGGFVPLAGPFTAPWQLQVPAGIPLLGEITIQGLIAEDDAGLNVSTTNAVIVDFVPAPSPSIAEVAPLAAGAGDTVTISGTGFSNGSTLTVDGIAVTPLTANSTTITYTQPAGVNCDATLVVTNPDTQTDSIGINPSPVINNIPTASGPAAGGTTLILVGENFEPGLTTVTVGGVPITLSSSTTNILIGLTPPGTPGPAQILVTTPAGCTVTDTFTYL